MFRKKDRKYQDPYLDRFLTEYYKVSRSDIPKYRENSRIALLNMEPYSSLKNKLPKTGPEKDAVLTLILSQIKQYKISEQLLEDKSRDLGNKLIRNCEGCKDRYEKQCALNGLDKLTWNKYFATNYYDFCSPNPEECYNSKLSVKDISLNNTINDRQKLIISHKNLEISYKVALEQQNNLVELYKTLISRYRENNAILIFKKNDIQRKINYIQLSVIFISAIITLFETIKPTIAEYMTESLLMIFPIALSTYIGLILAVGRFFKFDIKNEQIIKLIEKYSFIINKFVQKKDKVSNFDFKLKNVEQWDELLELEEKDNITDIILKASEERDIVLTPKEHIFYKKKYTKIFLKEQMESENLDTLSYLVTNTNNQNEIINKLVQKIIIKEPFFKYYFCCLWCCKPREYVDYEKVMLREAALISVEEICRQKAYVDTMNCENQFQKHKREKMERELMEKNIIEEYEKNKKLEEEAKKPVITLPNKLETKNNINYQISEHQSYLFRNRVQKQPPTSNWSYNSETGWFMQKEMNQLIKDLSNNETEDSSGNSLEN